MQKSAGRGPPRGGRAEKLPKGEEIFGQEAQPIWSIIIQLGPEPKSRTGVEHRHGMRTGGVAHWFTTDPCCARVAPCPSKSPAENFQTSGLAQIGPPPANTTQHGLARTALSHGHGPLQRRQTSCSTCPTAVVPQCIIRCRSRCGIIIIACGATTITGAREGL